MDSPTVSSNDALIPLERLVALERDNALMLSFLLDAHRLSFTLPPGASVNDVNYGAVDVPSMIERLRRNEVIDLSRALTASAVSRTAGTVDQAVDQAPASSSVQVIEKSSESASVKPTTSLNPFEAMLNSEFGIARTEMPAHTRHATTGTVGDVATFFSLDEAPTMSYSGELTLPALYSSLSDEDLCELAFEIVSAVRLDGETLETIRIALNVEQERANAIQTYARKSDSAIFREGISARIHLRSMLAAVERGALLEDEQFYKRRCRAAWELLWARQCIEQATCVPDHAEDYDEPTISASSVLSEINRMLSLSEIDALWVESAVEMIESVLNTDSGFSYPGTFGVKLYEHLLRTVFDQVEDYTLAYDAENILKNLEPVAHALGLTDEASREVILAFVIVKQAIMASKHIDTEYDDEQSPILALLAKSRAILRRSDVKMSPAIASAVNSLLTWGRFMLRDFMHTVTPPASHSDREVWLIEPEVFDLIVGMTCDAAKMMGKQANDIMMEVCQQSATAEYNRLRTTAMEDGNLQDGDATCASLKTIALLTARAADSFSAHLERYIANALCENSATGCFAARLGEYFKNDLFAWLASGPRLTIQSLETIWAVGDLQSALVAIGGDAVEPIGLEEHTSVLVFTWLNEKIDDLHTIVDRCISVEKWKVKNNDDPVPSAVDFLRAVNEMLDGFFSLRIPAHVSALRALTEGIDTAVGKYANAAARSLGSADDIIPPIPVMTRYKKSIVDDLHKKFTPVEPPRLPFEAGCVGASTVRLTSLNFLLDKMYLLEKDIIPKWKDMQRAAAMLTHPNAPHEVPKASWFEGLMEFARQSLRRSVAQVANHMAYNVIYRDLGGAMLQNIYAQGVHRSTHNLSTEVLPYLNGVLGYVAMRLDSKTRNLVGSRLLQATVSGWIRIILNGGPARVFVPTDVEMLEEEIEILSDFFIAGGQGLDAAEVAARVQPMSALCSLMSLPTDHLCQNYADLVEKERSNPPLENKNDPDAMNVYTADVTLRILCHRADHAASKWIKSNFSIGKTESGGSSMFSFM